MIQTACSAEVFTDIYITVSQLNGLLTAYFDGQDNPLPQTLLDDGNFAGYVNNWVEVYGPSLPDESTRLSFTNALHGRAMAFMNMVSEMGILSDQNFLLSRHYSFLMAAASTPLKQYSNMRHPCFDFQTFLAASSAVKRGVDLINQ